MLFLFSEQVRPDGVTLTVKLMLELNPLTAESVMVAVPEEPLWNGAMPEFEIVKSGMATAAMLKLTDACLLV